MHGEQRIKLEMRKSSISKDLHVTGLREGENSLATN